MNKTKRTETIEEFDEHGRLTRKTTTVEEIEEEPQKLTTTWTPTVTNPFEYNGTTAIKGVYSNEENN